MSDTDRRGPQARFRRILRDASLSALVALGLFGAMIGLRVDLGETGPVLTARPVALATVVGLVFVGRLAMLAWATRRRRPRPRAARTVAVLARARRGMVPLLVAAAIALPLYSGRAGIDLGTLVLIYVMLGWGLNIVVGLAGLLDLGYVAFYAVGAYAYALFSTRLGFGFWTCLPISGLLAGFCGVCLGLPVLRLRGDYLAIVTLAFGEIIRVVLLNWVSLTGGPNGIGGIPRPTLFGLEFSAAGGPGSFAGALGIEPSPTQRLCFLYYLILGLALLTNWAVLRLRRLPLGRAWEALREDEIACRSLGIDVTTTKLTAFAIGAAFGGLAGAFFATRNAFVSPESFTFIESALVLALVVLGGMGSQLGTALAAIVMIGGLGLLTRTLGDFGHYATALQNLIEARMLFFGVLLVAVMVLRPRGLVSGRKPSVALAEARDIPAALVVQGRG